jgi:hypothetical protein
MKHRTTRKGNKTTTQRDQGGISTSISNKTGTSGSRSISYNSSTGVTTKTTYQKHGGGWVSRKTQSSGGYKPPKEKKPKPLKTVTHRSKPIKFKKIRVSKSPAFKVSTRRRKMRSSDIWIFVFLVVLALAIRGLK